MAKTNGAKAPEIVQIEIKKIIPYYRNPRLNEQAVDLVKKSIELYGWGRPIELADDLVIICGHTRLEAAKQLGLKKVPCIIHKDMTPEQIKAYRIADNKLGELASWDYELLLPQLEYLEAAGVDTSLLDFAIVDLAEPIDDDVEVGQTDPDSVPEDKADEDPDSEAGRIYCLGEHRLLCGDSANYAGLQQLMAGQQADVLLTDPPYNVNVSNQSGNKIANDNMDAEEFVEFIESIFEDVAPHLKADGFFYIFHSDREAETFRQACLNMNWRILNTLHWVKNHAAFDRSDYHPQSEPCLFGCIKGARPVWNGPSGKSNLLRFPKAEKNPDHPTPKPVAMLSELLQDSSKPGDVVLDCFGGSGSTLIACEQTKRKCRMVEIDRHYCDVIRKRWAEYMYGENCEWKKITKGM